jgi:hypothetical protein
LLAPTGRLAPVDPEPVDPEPVDPQHPELTIWLGGAGQNDEPPLALPDVLRATQCEIDAIDRIARSQTGDATALERLLNDARDLMSVCAQAFLRGDPSAFASARGIRSERARAYTAELRNRGVLEAADAAWQNKDYGRVHDLLNPLRDSLDEHHLRRLNFAEQRLG